MTPPPNTSAFDAATAAGGGRSDAWIEDRFGEAQIGWKLQALDTQLARARDIERQLRAEKDRVRAAGDDWALDALDAQLDELHAHVAELDGLREELVDELGVIGLNWPRH